MTTRKTKLTPADLAPSVGPDLGHPAASMTAGSAVWRLTLDSAWQHKIDEVIMLSEASSGLISDSDTSLPDRGVRVSSRLYARTERAYEELAAIEDAIARIDDGTYGVCAGCDQTMSDEWLTEKPEARYCPDCSLRLVSWTQSDLPEMPKSPGVTRGQRKGSGSVRRRQGWPVPVG